MVLPSLKVSIVSSSMRLDDSREENKYLEQNKDEVHSDRDSIIEESKDVDQVKKI